ncbi:MAG: hypothetical protein HQL76_07230 [Magnetococcales bacterium]|nr:hypothetical protein [Magnetococcales bacterium]
MSFMRGLLALYLIFLVLFFAAAPFLTLWLYAEDDLSRSLLPQLIGFCLQGAFLVVVFAVYEKRTTLNAKRSHKFALRSALGSLIRPLERPDVTPPGNPPMPLALIQREIMDQGLTEKMGQALGQNAQRGLVSLESLTVLAAQIDADHLEIWGGILDQLHRLATSMPAKQTNEAAIDLLDLIRDFDDLYID